MITRKLILIILLAISSCLSFGLTIKTDTLRFEVLLTRKMLTDINVNECLVNSFDITSRRLVLLSTNDQFYLLGWGGIVPFEKKIPGVISSFAFTPDSLLMTIHNNELCCFDSLGNLSKLFKLPNPGMGICAGKYAMYVYDKNAEQKLHALYMIARGGKYVKVFDVPGPINAVVETNTSLLFATGNGLFNYTPKNKELKALAVLPKDKKIISIAADASGGVIYFSTNSVLYAIRDSNVVTLTDKYD